MDAQKRGVLSGIHGRLGDLGTIDQLYDCAITTSCGFLDHILVETVGSAEKCIQFLRENQIGQGRFICQDKMHQQFKSLREKPFEEPANSKRLFDLVKIQDPKFADAFYFALKDTLVCENIDTASKIAYGQ